MSSITLVYTAQHDGNTVYTVTLDRFTGFEVARTFGGGAQFSRSRNGTSILGGPAYREKRIWGLSVVLSGDQTADLYAMFNAWDKDRASGRPVACQITDNTFIEEVSTSALFTTPPSFTRMGYSGEYVVDFAMAEV